MTRAFATADITNRFESAPARLTIDLGAIVENWRMLARLSGKARTGAVVKADAYGLGAVPVGTALAKAGCTDFFVATVEEGVRLRSALPDVRIVLLAGLWEGLERRVIDNNLVPAIGSMQQLAVLRAMGADQPHALYVDTGMNRLGLTISEAVALGAEASAKPVLVLSHLACPDTPDHPMNERQRQAFEAVRSAFSGVESSLASSAGIFLGTDYHCDLTRPGIALYGGEAVQGVANPMRPVATVEARILQVRQVAAGDAVSYGATHVFERDGRVAILGAGYADGWHRALSGAGVPLRGLGGMGASALIDGHRAPIIGRITMDLTMVDVTDVPENFVVAGGYAELFGHGISLDDAARAAGTIGYELLTSLGQRYSRRYL